MLREEEVNVSSLITAAEVRIKTKKERDNCPVGQVFSDKIVPHYLGKSICV